MKLMGPMLVVKDMNRSKAFYQTVLGLRIISDFGANVTFTGGLSVQTEASWIDFTDSKDDFVTYKGNDAEFYFEQEELEQFIEKIDKLEIQYINKLTTMPWGQRVVRFYDPDMHIIEVAEPLTELVLRLFKEGMNTE